MMAGEKLKMKGFRDGYLEAKSSHWSYEIPLIFLEIWLLSGSETASQINTKLWFYSYCSPFPIPGYITYSWGLPWWRAIPVSSWTGTGRGGRIVGTGTMLFWVVYKTVYSHRTSSHHIFSALVWCGCSVCHEYKYIYVYKENKYILYWLWLSRRSML